MLYAIQKLWSHIRLKGVGEFVTEGPLVEPYHKLAQQMFKGALDAKGALVITPSKIIVCSPTPDNGKVFIISQYDF